METKRVKIKVGSGLDDSDLISYMYTLNDDTLVFNIQGWDASSIKISFFNVMRFIDTGSQWTCGFYELTSHSTFLEQALKEPYPKIQEKGKYKVYQILDLDDEPSYEIICEKFEVAVEKYRPDSSKL